MSLCGSEREERGKIRKEFWEHRCNRKGEKKNQEILQGDSTRVLVVHTSVRSPTTQLAHSICHVYPQQRGPRRTNRHGQASSVLKTHFEFTQFELHTGKDGQPDSKYLSLCPQIIIALVSQQINLSIQQMDTMTENHHCSKYREQVIMGVKSHVIHL